MTEVSTQSSNSEGFDECPGSKFMEYPTAYDFIHLLIEEKLYHLYMIIAALVFYVCIFTMFTKLFYNCWKIKDEVMRADVLISVATPLAISSFCVIGIFFPRSNPLLYSVGLTYLMLALWRCFSLFLRLYGDTDHMVNIMQRADVRLKLGVYPVCFLFFLPTISPSLRNINIFKALVLQTLCLRILLQMVIDVIRTEGLCDNTAETRVLMWGHLVSTLLAAYGCSSFVGSSVLLVEKYKVQSLFRVINLTQAIFNIQRFILERMSFNADIFADMYFDIVDDKRHKLEVLEARVQADFWYNFLMICWLVPLSLLISYYVRPGQCALFDLPAFPIAHIDTNGDFPRFDPTYAPSFRNTVVDMEIVIQGGLTADERRRTATLRTVHSLNVPDTKY